MELNKNLTEKALSTLRFEGDSVLPKQIGDTPFFIAEADDATILAHGAVEHEGMEYKIGTKKT